MALRISKTKTVITVSMREQNSRMARSLQMADVSSESLQREKL